MRALRFRLRLACVAAMLFASSLPAQLAPIGLSEMGAQFFVHPEPPPPPSPAGDRDDEGGRQPTGNNDQGDQFGASFAVGDFDGDGADDLATGAPGDNDLVNCGGIDCGSVVLRYGTVGGRLGQVATVLRQAPEAAFPEERFGSALAAGDFDDDGFDDLAVGVPGNEPFRRGAVLVYFGSASGIVTSSSQFLNEAATGDTQHLCTGSRFGQVLTAGDFDGDGRDDLAIGVPNGCERVGEELVQSGAIFVAHGTASGIVPFYGYRISQNSIFIFEDCEGGDQFGAALAAGNFDADGPPAAGYDDLAIGIPGEGDHGAVEVIFGSQFGLIFEDSIFWAPGALGEVPEIGDELARTLAAGDFDGDGHDDLAVGDPSESLGASNEIEWAGSVDIAYGSPAGFDLARTDRFTQSTILGAGADQESDRFGYGLAAVDFDGDGRSDLAIGHPGEQRFVIGAGAVTVILGEPGGFGMPDRYRTLSTGYEGLPGDAFQIQTAFGGFLAGGDFDGNGFGDLVVGLPNYDVTTTRGDGAELVLYGALFADGFEVASFGRWSSSAP